MNNSKKRIGKYIIFLGARLGHGAFSEVFQGVNQETKEEVAIKIVNKAKINEDQYTKTAFYSEIQINKKLKSGNIIQFYDVHETANNFYIVLQLAQGGTLRQVLKKAVKQTGRLQEKKVMKFLIQILNGFGELVKNGITHRDLKPENILIKDEILKLADFGFAKHSENNSFLQTIVGTPAYMAPQILNEERYTYKCDIWSLGVMTYEMVIGQIPWDFKNNQTLQGFKTQINTRKIVVPQNICSPNMRTFILGCLCIDQAKRYDWEQIFLHDLFGTKFQANFLKAKIGSTQIGFIVSSLRMNLHSKNINLTKVLERIDQKMKQGDFIDLMRFIYKEITPQEIIFLYKYLADNEGFVVKNDFIKLLTKHQIRMTGIDLSRMEMEVQQGTSTSYMISSKKRYEILNKLKIIIDKKNISLSQLFKKKGLYKYDTLDVKAFGNIILTLDDKINEKEIQSLFKEFDTNLDGKLTVSEAYKGLCKIAEIVPMEQQ